MTELGFVGDQVTSSQASGKCCFQEGSLVYGGKGVVDGSAGGRSRNAEALNPLSHAPPAPALSGHLGSCDCLRQPPVVDGALG